MIHPTAKRIAKRVLGVLGHWLAVFLPLRNRSGVFFFFPYYHIGGAEKVHADIVTTLAAERPWVIFTHSSRGDGFKGRFESHAKVHDISEMTRFFLLRSILAGVWAGIVDRHDAPVVFGGNTPFFYEVLRCLKKKAYCLDLLHAFGGGIEHDSLPMVGRLDRRVVISRSTYEDLERQYLTHAVNPKFLERIVVIENMAEGPDEMPKKSSPTGLRVLYVGRGSSEKRVYLVGEIAKACLNAGLPFEFVLVGDVAGALPVAPLNCTIVGEVRDQSVLVDLYGSADVLLVTSSREGFPMVIMEAMAHGVVPIATDVGGIRYHLNGNNGFLVPDALDEPSLVRSFVQVLETFHSSAHLRSTCPRNAYEYARRHFGRSRFESSYRALFSSVAVNKD